LLLLLSLSLLCLLLLRYDVKRALTEAGESRAQVEKARTTLVPRKKFAFGKAKSRGEKPSGEKAAAESHLDGGTADAAATAGGAHGSSTASAGASSGSGSSAVAEATHCWAGKVLP
jgi:hypothetical protein